MYVCEQSEEVAVGGDKDAAAEGYSVGSLDKPTTRLSQYARGKTGSMNPFTPGGEVGLPMAVTSGHCMMCSRSRSFCCFAKQIMLDAVALCRNAAAGVSAR